jgi:hypothetical protein
MRVWHGQNTVEMALLLPLLALLIAFALDFARVFQVAAIVANSSRTAAEFGATQGFESPQVSEVREKAKDELGDTLKMAPGTEIRVFRPDDTEFGSTDTLPSCGKFRVSVKVVFQPIIPLARIFAPSGQSVVRDTSMRRSGPKPDGCTNIPITW